VTSEAASPSFRTGGLEVHQVVEAAAAPPLDIFRPTSFLPGLDPRELGRQRSALSPTSLDPATNTLVLRLQSHLVRIGSLTILVDTCVGNHKERPGQPYWSALDSPAFEASLRAAGATFESIDVVLCTHLHVDHVGWNTRLEDGVWVPTFPNATYVFPAQDLDHHLPLARRSRGSLPWIDDSVEPILASDQVVAAGPTSALPGGTELVPAPGHTAGHAAYRLGHGATTILFAGDVVHSPLQLALPDLAMRADHDAELARRSRRRVLEMACEPGTVFCPAHFASPALGRIEATRDAFELVPC